MLSPPSLLVTVLDPLASLTLSLVTTLLELDELGFELELEVDFFSGSLDDEDDLEDDEGVFSEDEDGFAFSYSRALSAAASELDLEPEDEDELDDVARGLGTSGGLLSSWLSIWSENMSNSPNASSTRFTIPVSCGLVNSTKTHRS